jgi:pimeloyl-ACP methyl ester carboxylesterase
MPVQHRGDIGINYAEAGTGRPMIFLHSLNSDHTEWEYQIPYFSERYRTIAIDLPGHGESSLPASDDDITLEAYGGHVAWLCDHLGLEGVVLVGRAMGGRVAMHVAADRPDLIAALAVLDSAIAIPAEFLAAQAQLVAQLEAMDEPELRATYRAFQDAHAFLPIDDPKIRTRLLDRFSSGPVRVILAGLRDTVRFGAQESLGLLGRIEPPVLYIASSQRMAERDQLFDARPDLQFAQVACSGHSMNLHVPDQVNAMIDRFLDVVGVAHPGAA